MYKAVKNINQIENEFKTKEGPTAKWERSVRYPSKVLRKETQKHSTAAMQTSNTDDKYVFTLFASSEM